MTNDPSKTPILTRSKRKNQHKNSHKANKDEGRPYKLHKNTITENNVQESNKNNVPENNNNVRPEENRSENKSHDFKMKVQKRKQYQNHQHQNQYSNDNDKKELNDKKLPRPQEIARIVLPTNIFSDIAGLQSQRDHTFSRTEEKYLQTLEENHRKFLVEEVLKSSSITKIPMRFRVIQSNIPNKNEILQKLQNSCEGGKYDTWLESLLALPLGKLAPPPIEQTSQIGSFLKETRHKMDNFVYGQHEAKDEIMRLLCQWSSSGSLSTFAVALEGPPGIGKTTFAKNVVAKVMNRPFNFISLGGATDAAHLTGHSYTYEGAIPGRIAECLKNSKVMNPCFYFDELDKISKTAKGDEITNLLVHMTDREQNSQFHDRYFSGIPLDISQSLLIFSYNFYQDISPVLMDRLNVIKLKAPTTEEKIQIAKLHLIPKALKESALTNQIVNISDEHIEHIITHYTNESGVRNLEKCIGKIISTIGVLFYAPDVLTSINTKDTKITKITTSMDCTQNLIDTILNSSTKKEENHHLMMYN